MIYSLSYNESLKWHINKEENGITIPLNDNELAEIVTMLNETNYILPCQD